MSTEVRRKILETLQQARETPISGEELAERLGVSRVAVWKHVQALRRSGYAIAARPNVGYQLLAAPDLPLAEAVEPLLRTKRIGRHYHFYMRVGSTNTEARRLAEAGAVEGTTVVADEQTAGRGRRGRNWLSAPGSGIWMSVILRPHLATSRAGTLTLMSAVAVREAIRAETGVEAMIKWPNDILIGERKVCGILVELSADQENVHYAVVGIGLNVRPPADGFPPDVARTATTLEEAAGSSFSRVRLVAALCEHLEHWYEPLLRGDISALLDAWRNGCPWLGERVEIRQNDRVFPAVAEDVCPDGGLLVRDDEGRRRVVYAADVSLRRAR